MNISAVSFNRMLSTPTLKNFDTKHKENSNVTTSISNITPQDIQASHTAYVIQNGLNVSFTDKSFDDATKTVSMIVENMEMSELGNLEDYSLIDENVPVLKKPASGKDPYNRYILCNPKISQKAIVSKIKNKDAEQVLLNMDEGFLKGFVSKIDTCDFFDQKLIRQYLASLPGTKFALLKSVPIQDYGKSEFKNLTDGEIKKNIERDNILAKAKVAEFDFYKKFGDTYQVQDNGLKLDNKAMKKISKLCKDFDTSSDVLHNLSPKEIGDISEYKPLNKEYSNIRIKNPTKEEPFYKIVMVGSTDEYVNKDKTYVNLSDKELDTVNKLRLICEIDGNFKSSITKNAKEAYKEMINLIGKKNNIAIKYIPNYCQKDYAEFLNNQIKNEKIYQPKQSQKEKDSYQEYLSLDVMDALKIIDSANKMEEDIHNQEILSFDKKLRGGKSDMEKEIERDAEYIYKEKYKDNENDKYFKSLYEEEKAAFERELASSKKQ